MKKINIILSLFIMLGMLSSPSYAQPKKLAQTGLQFLKVDVGARTAAMGGINTTTNYDASAMFYNPAGMALMDTEWDFMANQTMWIADIGYSAIGLAKTFEGIGTFGISTVFADYGDIEGTVIAANEAGYIKTGNISVNAYAVGLSYARSLSEQFAIGGQVKYVTQELGESQMSLNPDDIKENKVDGVAFDFGTVFYPGWNSFRFGMSVRNFGDELEYEKESFQIPLTFTFGIAMDVFDFTDIEDQSLVLAVDAIHPRDFTERVHVGMEYLFLDMFAVRGGYKFNYDIESFSGGLGFYMDISGLMVKADYSYSDMEYFDGVNRFTIGLGF